MRRSTLCVLHHAKIIIFTIIVIIAIINIREKYLSLVIAIIIIMIMTIATIIIMTLRNIENFVEFRKYTRSFVLLLARAPSEISREIYSGSFLFSAWSRSKHDRYSRERSSSSR